jgi:DNA-3-methyladenine glycosylase
MPYPRSREPLVGAGQHPALALHSEALVARILASTPLPRSFYARPVLTVAKDCIGQILVHRTVEGEVAGRIVEVEAYRGPQDRAAHSYGGRRTRRTEAMFGPAGHA